MLKKVILWYNDNNYTHGTYVPAVKGWEAPMETNTEYTDKELAAERLANASFVLGIISLVSVLCCCPFVFSAIGIILALLSKGAEQTLRPRAKTGLILSIVGMVVSVVLLVFTVVFPVVMYTTNPEFKKNIDQEIVRSLEQQEDLFRQTYGDDLYERMLEQFENGGGF